MEASEAAIDAHVESLGPTHFPQLHSLPTPSSRDGAIPTRPSRTEVYLDNAGASPYPAPLIQSVLKETLLGGNGGGERREEVGVGRPPLFGNPHSLGSPSASLTAEKVEQARAEVLRFLDVTPADYTCIFTANASAALRLVSESVRWARKEDLELLLSREADAYSAAETEGRATTDGDGITPGPLTAKPNGPATLSRRARKRSALLRRPVAVSFLHLRESHTSVVGMREAVLDAAGVGPEDEGFESETESEGECVDRSVPRGRDRVRVVELDEMVAWANESERRGGVAAAAESNGVADGDTPTAVPNPLRPLPPTLFNLLALPLQCNFTGRRIPLALIDRILSDPYVSLLSTSTPTTSASARPATPLPTLLLLDASSHLTTSSFSLRRHPAHFLCLSFYKMFGYPTGLGALIVRNDCLPVLWARRYFGGGTVDGVVSGGGGAWPWVKRRGEDDVSGTGTVPAGWPSAATAKERGSPPVPGLGSAARFEDGTVDYLGILTLEKGFEYLRTTFGVPMGGGTPVTAVVSPGVRDASTTLAMSTLSLHSRSLTSRCWRAMDTLRHADGSRVCEMYSACPSTSMADSTSPYEPSQGPIVAFNLLRPASTWSKGRKRYVGYSEVLTLASVSGVHLRTGAFCNAGAFEVALGVEGGEVRSNFEVHGHVCWDSKDVIAGKPTGAVRVSFGMANTRSDVDAWVRFLRAYFVSAEAPTTTSLESTSTSALVPVPPHLSSPSMSSSATVSHLAVFPFKSCGAYSIPRGRAWPIGPSGFLGDRKFALVDQQGTALSQKRVPAMALVRPREVSVEGDDGGWAEVQVGEETVRVEMGGKRNEKSEGGEEVGARVCGERVTASSFSSPHLSSLLSSVLSLPAVRVIETTSSTSRKSKLLKQTPDSPAAAPSLSFANESQFLLVNRASHDAVVADLRARGDADRLAEDLAHLDPSCYRANIVAQGMTAWEEEGWVGKRIVVGDGAEGGSTQTFRVLAGCGRCAMVCVDQRTGNKGREPYGTLSRMGKKAGGRLIFGVHLQHVPEESTRPYVLQEGWNVAVKD